MSAERVDLLLRVHTMPDPGDVRTWTLDAGRVPTSAELALLQSLTAQDIDDWETLVHLAGDLKRSLGQP